MTEYKYIISDTYIIKNFMSDPDDILERMKEDVTWSKFHINGKELARDGCFQGDQHDGYTPWLRCPSIEGQTILPWSQSMLDIKETISKTFPTMNFNIGKIQKYNSGKITIGAHADKVLDLKVNVPILIARFGADRTCVLTHKVTGETIRIPVPHNSLLVLGWKTNLEWKHSIEKDTSIKDPSYSIVFRESVTFKVPTNYVFGERTPFKTLNDLSNASWTYWSREEQREHMIECFHKENTSTNVDGIYDEFMKNAVYAF